MLQKLQKTQLQVATSMADLRERDAERAKYAANAAQAAEIYGGSGGGIDIGSNSLSIIVRGSSLCLSKKGR